MHRNIPMTWRQLHSVLEQNLDLQSLFRQLCRPRALSACILTAAEEADLVVHAHLVAGLLIVQARETLLQVARRPLT